VVDHAPRAMKQVVDNDLDPFEHRELVTELKQVIIEANDPNELHLAESLLAYVQSKEVRWAIQPNLLERLLDNLRQRLSGWPPRLFLKVVLIVGFGFIVVQSAVKLLAVVRAGQTKGTDR